MSHDRARSEPRRSSRPAWRKRLTRDLATIARLNPRLLRAIANLAKFAAVDLRVQRRRVLQ
jgi:hypothetical protein